VVKAFNTLPATVLSLGRDVLARQRVSLFTCGDDAAAKVTVAELGRAIGLLPVDSGPLAGAWMLDALADFVRFQIGNMGLGMFATLSLGIVEPE
jgi:8-hydroxy-5-deazaflavin:NADPH oxidoreductase